jgi:hypothetical protein
MNTEAPLRWVIRRAYDVGNIGARWRTHLEDCDKTLETQAANAEYFKRIEDWLESVAEVLLIRQY